MKLFEINARMRELMETVDDDGLITTEAMDELVALQVDGQEKVEDVACYIKELRAEATAVKAEADVLAKRAKAAANRADGLENYLAAQMDQMGMDKYSSPRVALSYRTSKAVEADVGLLPPIYVKVKTEPDKVALAAVLKAGNKVPGAYLVERRRLNIK